MTDEYDEQLEAEIIAAQDKVRDQMVSTRNHLKRLQEELDKLIDAQTCDHDWDLLPSDDFSIYLCKHCGFKRRI